jgi:hypothetical protein
VVPGNTPYVRTDADLTLLLQRLNGYLMFFRDELRGRFVTPDALKAELERLAPHRPQDSVPPQPVAVSPRRSRARCGPGPSR